MADTFDRALEQRFSVLESGSSDFDLVVDDEGLTVYDQKMEPMGQPTLENPQMNPFAMPDVPGQRETAGEFTQTIGAGTAGTLAGATAVTAGLPGDLLGLTRGIGEMLAADEGERLASFLEEFAETSERYGSERTLSILEERVEDLPFSDEVKSDIMAGSKYIGEWAELPLGLKAMASGVRRYAAGAPARVAERGRGTTLQSGMDPRAPIDQAIVGVQNMLRSGQEQKDAVVSTRVPTAKSATEDPIADRLRIDIDAARADERAFNRNAEIIKTYPNIRYAGDDAAEASNELVEHVKDNLLYLYDSVPEATRQRSKQWYAGANRIVEELSQEYEVPDSAAAGVMAVLSPQQDWFMNASLGQRVIDIHTSKANEPWTDEMMQTAQRIFGQEKYAPVLQSIANKSYSELENTGEKAMWLRIYDETYNPRSHQLLSPEGEALGPRTTQTGEEYGTRWGSNSMIAKAIDILENPTRENISAQLGGQHKVRNFYNNIYAPMDEAGDVTIDTHAVAAGLMRPLSGRSAEVEHNLGSNIANSSRTGAKGTYGLYADAYRQAAAERGVLPREMQSITWEAVKGLFSPQYKRSASDVQFTENVWNRYKSGEITADEARNEIVEHAGGINPPEWQGRDGGVAGEVQNTGDAGELSGPSVPGRGTQRPQRGGNPDNTGEPSPETVNIGSDDPAMGADS